MNKLETKGPGDYKIFIVGGDIVKPEYEIGFMNETKESLEKGELATTLTSRITLSDGRDAVMQATSMKKYGEDNVKAIIAFEGFKKDELLNDDE
jgi:hypothetical protein